MDRSIQQILTGMIHKTSTLCKQVFFFFRRKQYTLCGSVDDRGMSVERLGWNLNSVRQIEIYQEQQINSHVQFLENATELHFKKGFKNEGGSIANLLHRIVSLEKITKLMIECEHFSLYQLIDLLACSPNIHTLIYQSIPFHKDDHLFTEQNQIFRRVCQTNTIKCVTFQEECTMDRVEFLVTLCPRVEYLSINVPMEILKSVTRFLLDKSNPNTRHLCSICFSRISQPWLVGLDGLIKFERLLDDYVYKSAESRLYLWW